MSKDVTLLVMAAGMGSRFGGLKQMEPMGPNGEALLDFSVHDAKEAGFTKTVFIIKQAIADDFCGTVGKRIEKMMDVSYVFQEVDDLPGGFTAPADRTKPWGTVQAVWAARHEITTPFAVINADDYYGKSAYRTIYDRLLTEEDICMVGFELSKTLTENGAVTRGICQVEDGYLRKVVEQKEVTRDHGFPEGTVASMNMWGFTPAIFPELEERLIAFLKENTDPLKGEFVLPTVVDQLIRRRDAKVTVLSSIDQWYGVTYREDKEPVQKAMMNYIREGKYPSFAEC